MINVIFNKMTNLANDHKIEIYRTKMPQAPSKGDLVNVNGYPYIVQDRGWVVSKEPDHFGNIGETCCYLDIWPMF